jgi:hypothetical protein
MFVAKSQQKTIFDLEFSLPEKMVKNVKKTWAETFSRYILPLLVKAERDFADLYCPNNGTPNVSVALLLGVLILKEMFDLTDEETLEHLEFNILWQYALDVRFEDAHVCRKTLHNFRTKILQSGRHRKLFNKLTKGIIELFGLKTRKQRLDSTHVVGNMKIVGRLGLFTQTIEQFLFKLKAMSKKDQKIAEYLKNLPPEFHKRYLEREGYFCDARSSQAKRRLEDCAQDLWYLVELFKNDSQICKLQEFKNLKRLFEEQCEVVKKQKKVEIQVRNDPAVEENEACSEESTEGGDENKAASNASEELKNMSQEADQQGELAGQQGELMDQQGESANPQGESVGQQAEPTNPQGESVKPQGESVGQKVEPMKPQGESVNPQGESANPQGESLDQKAEPTNPQGESVNPQGESAIQQGESVNPQGESVIQQGESNEAHLNQKDLTVSEAGDSRDVLDSTHPSQEDHAVRVREKNEIGSDSLQSPSDPDATYGHKGKGYEFQVSETCDKENPFEVITETKLNGANESDQTQTIPMIEKLDKAGLHPEELTVDAGYGSGENIVAAEEKGTVLIGPLPGKPPDPEKLSLANFEFNEDGTRVERCPNGKSPIDQGMSKHGDSYFAKFSPDDCAHCPLRDRCPVKGESQKRLDWDKTKHAIDKRQREVRTKDFKEKYKIRSGIEATNSELKNKHGAGHLRVRGFARIDFTMVMKSLAVNVKRMIQYALAIPKISGKLPSAALIFSSICIWISLFWAFLSSLATTMGQSLHNLVLKTKAFCSA